jgi:ribosomal protein L32
MMKKKTKKVARRRTPKVTRTDSRTAATAVAVCDNCGQPLLAHYLANYADGLWVGAEFTVCPTAVYSYRSK